MMAFRQEIILVCAEGVGEAIRAALAVKRVGECPAAIRRNHRTSNTYRTAPTLVRKFKAHRPPRRALHAERPVEPQSGIAKILFETNRIAVDLLYDGVPCRQLSIDSKGCFFRCGHFHSAEIIVLRWLSFAKPSTFGHQFFQVLQMAFIDTARAAISTLADRSSHTYYLTHHACRAHHAHRAESYMRNRDIASGHEEIPDIARIEAAIGNCITRMNCMLAD